MSSKPRPDEELVAIVIKVAKKYPQGISAEDLQKECDWNTVTKKGPEALTELINILLKSGRLGVTQGHLLLCTSETADQKGLSAESRLIYQEILDSGRNGIWSKDLRSKAAVTQKALETGLKQLETKKLIKSVKKKGTNKKMYMGIETEPSDALTGGVWFDGEMNVNSDFIASVTKIIVDCVTKAGSQGASLIEIYGAVAADEELAKNMTVRDIEKAIDMCNEDQKIRLVGEPGDAREGIRRYVAQRVLPLKRKATAPCGYCDYYSHCGPRGEYNPVDCKYLNKFLEF